MFFQQVLHTMDAETLSIGAGKQHVSCAALRLTEPGFQYGERRSGNRCAAFFTALADYAYVGPGAEDKIFACEAGHLG